MKKLAIFILMIPLILTAGCANFACEGFTGDGSHLPDKFDSVDKVLLEIANSD